jgi:hypothetical protein
MKEYRGEDDPKYFDKLNDYLQENDLTLNTLKISKGED